MARERAKELTKDVLQILVFILKLALASILLGAALSAFDMSAADILQRVGMTPERVSELISQALAWALPNLVLGSMIILPLWGLAFVLRPPRG